MADYERVNHSSPIFDSSYHGKRDIGQKSRKMHWSAPTTMLASLLFGAVFAVAHDRYYHHYDEKQVVTTLEQKVVLNVGTAFAFLVKMFFVIATGIAFSQQLWLEMKKGAEALEDIDSLFDVLSNFFCFWKIMLWSRHWLLALLALVTWSLPIAAVFTPGTIHIEPAVAYTYDVPMKPYQPQQQWYGTQKFGSVVLDATAEQRIDNHTWESLQFYGPSDDLYSVALGSVIQKGVLRMETPSANMSYGLSFYAPAISCENVTVSEKAIFDTALATAYNASWLPGMGTIWSRFAMEGDQPYLAVKYNAWLSSNATSTDDLAHPSWNNESKTNYGISTANRVFFYFSFNKTLPGQSALVACHLHNASYTTSFSFENFQQSINISVAIKELVPWADFIDGDDLDYSNLVYNAIAAAFNTIFVGAATNNTAEPDTNIQYFGGPVSISAIQDFIEEKPGTVLTADAIMTTLEDIFQNITISTFSSTALRLPDENATMINATTWRAVNKYVYDPRDLYLAYGCAFCVTAICVLWGLFVMLCRNRVSYSRSFSAVLRTTRQSAISEAVPFHQRLGSDPLPNELGRTKLRYSSSHNDHEDGFEIVQSEFNQETTKLLEGSAVTARASDAVPISPWTQSHVRNSSNHSNMLDLSQSPRVVVRRKPLPDTALVRTYSS